MSPKHHHEPRKSPYAYSQEAFHTGWTHHSHALTDNFLRAADAVSLADLQHSPLPAAERLDSLQHKLGHLFTHRNLLLLALTHPSVRRLKLADPTCARSSHAPTRTRRALGAHSALTRLLRLPALLVRQACSQGSPNSKVLSWMGDSALNLAVTEQLAGSNIESVGELTEARARLVSRENCCSCARHFGLGELMIIGKSVLISNGGPTDDMLGEAMEADSEDWIDAVTALSGGGPAYVFLLIEALAAAGARAGLPEDLSVRLARATVSGSGELARQAAEPASQLRRNVTSPGGTTAEALKVLMADDGIQPIFDRAIAAATRRSQELAG